MKVQIDDSSTLIELSGCFNLFNMTVVWDRRKVLDDGCKRVTFDTETNWISLMIVCLPIYLILAFLIE